MNTPSFLEDHVSQLPALQLLINMGYTYLSPAEAMKLRGGKTSQVLLDGVLHKQLDSINSIRTKGKEYDYTSSNIDAAIRALKELPIQDGFMNANIAFYDLITLGKSLEQKIEGDKKSYTLQYIDWETPGNNKFHVTEEYSVARDGSTETYRPDLVLFINGIPMVVIECKSPALAGTKTPVELACEQHIRNFSKKGIRSLYMYSNLLLSVAGNDASYATTGTSKEFWSKWKEQPANKQEENTYTTDLQKLKNQPLDNTTKDNLYSERYKYVRSYFDELEKESRTVTKQDEVIYSLCRQDRILDMMRNFILYDNGIKKVARYQQYFAIKASLKRVAKIGSTGKRKGGVVWHTQGSGKSLTMVMLAQLLAKEITNPKIVLVTDRIDLDDQISDTFKKCQKEVVQATTGSHLAELLNDEKDDAIITTIINKFEAAVKYSKTEHTSPNIFVLIDEGHRTQYGTFGVSMERVFPNACFIAFTGTPLMHKAKTSSKFGGFIGIPYTVDDAVRDKAVVPLLYEGRHNLFRINEEPLNRYFDKISEPLTPYGKVALSKKFSSINEINKADAIIYSRAWDISEHYTQFFQTHNDKYKPKAQLVAPSIKAALLFQDYLKTIGKVTSEVVVTESDKREGVEDGYYSTNAELKREQEYFDAMRDKYGDIKSYEKSIISQFKKREHPEILIVVAKLLTGFDAPSNTVLYLNKSLKGHTLLQAVARVNRVFPGKDYGYIIDYVGNLENLDEALTTYSGLEGFDEDDLKGTLTTVKVEVEKLPQAHSDLWDIFKSIKGKKAETTDYEEILEPEDLRNDFYTKLSVFGRLLKLALSSLDFVKNTEASKVDKYKKDAKFFFKLRIDVKRRFFDDISYQEYEPQIQKLINQHISTEGEIMQITDLVNIFDKDKRETELEKIKGKAAQADHIASRTLKSVNVKMIENEAYYKKFAQLIRETIDDYHQKRISEAEYLLKAKSFEKDFLEGNREDVPEEIADNSAALGYFDFSKEVYIDQKTDFHLEVSLLTEKIIKEGVYLNNTLIIDWENNEDVKGKLNIELGDALYELHQKYDIDTDWALIDKLILECIKVATRNYN